MHKFMDSKKRIALLLAFMLAFSMCFNTSFVSAKSLAELQKEIKQKEKELKEGKEKEKNLSKKVNDLEKSVDQLEEQIGKSEGKLSKLEDQLDEAQKKVDDQNKALESRLRIMYKNGSVGFMDVLMNSGSFSEFLTNVDLVQRIYRSDERVLENLKDSHDAIKSKKDQVARLQRNLKSSKATAENQQGELEKQKAAIAKDNKETAKMLDQMESEANALAASLAAKAKSGEISSSQTSTYSGGVFLWPLPSSQRITSGYGWRKCPFHGKEFHPAIDIGASSGSAILAAADGKVISSSFRSSFGNCIIIDHGGGVTTWYNHMSARLVSVGATVKKGQQIGKVGSTGSSTGPHLDFRVYVNGSAKSPLSYFQ